MKKYEVIFFDLDHTLWDFDLNSAEAITELFSSFGLSEYGITDASSFISVYRGINEQMWELYHKNLISKSELRAGRFNATLKHFNVVDLHLGEQMASEYLRLSPEKKNLFPGTLDILDYLSEKYQLHIITNGFKEVQHTKIRNSGIKKYFERIHISEEIGYKKPQPEIFNFAVKESGKSHDSCIMIGDNLETDIAGAHNVGIDHVYFNPGLNVVPDTVKHSVSSLHQLKELL